MWIPKWSTSATRGTCPDILDYYVPEERPVCVPAFFQVSGRESSVAHATNIVLCGPSTSRLRLGKQ